MKQILFYTLLLPLIGTTNLYGQHRKLQNRPYIDQRPFHLGFVLGLHTQDLILTQSGFINDDGEVWFSEIPAYTPGFVAGIIANLYLNRYMSLRIIPTLYLGEKQFVFREQSSGNEYSTGVRNNYISLPIEIKFSSHRINNFRPYLISGGYINIEPVSKKNQAIMLKQYDFGVETGFGCDFYLPMFKLAPEIKFCFGLIDILKKDRSDLKDETLRKYAQSLSKATQRMIILSFNFE